jgi:hypothetical protein
VPNTMEMVRWWDGVYGGLTAGLTSAGFYALSAAVWLHDESPAAPFLQIVRALPGLHGVTGRGPALAGAAVYVVTCAVLGILYGLLARNVRSMWRAPTSVLWGLAYGSFVWWLLTDVAVPLLGAVDMRPLWEGLVGTVVFYGVVLSEITTMARRRAVASP